jgi:hypothetical protein
MSKKFRTAPRHDVMPPPVKKSVAPGKIGEHKLGVYDGKGRLRGQVGVKASSATASRFHGQLGSTIGKVNGRKAWLAPKEGSPKCQTKK